MAVAVLTVYEQDDPPVAGGGATPLGTIDHLLHLSARPVLSTKGLNSVQLQVNRNDSTAALLQAGRWVTVAFPHIQTDPVMTVRLGPSHTVVIGEQAGDEVIHVAGLGILSLLERMRLPEEPNAPSPPASTERGSSTIAGIWHWLTQPFGAILTRTIEEGQHLPGAPLAPITITFDRDEDSDGNAWVSMATDRFFEASTGASGWNVYQRGAEAGDIFLVERFDFQVDAYTAFGSASFGVDRTSATYATGKVRVYAAPDDTASNLLTSLEETEPDERYTHVLVEGANKTFVEVAAPWWTTEPGRWTTVEYTDSDDPDMLERVGLEFLRRQEARTVAREVEIKPGDSPTTGRYLPWKHINVGDLITVDAGGIDEAARVVAFRVELVDGAHDDTTEDAHRSLRVVLELNEVSGGEGGEGGDGIGGDGGVDSGLCCGPRPPTQGAAGGTFRLYMSGHNAGDDDFTPQQSAAPNLGASDRDGAWNGIGTFDYRMLYAEPGSTHTGSAQNWTAVNTAAGYFAITGGLVRLGGGIDDPDGALLAIVQSGSEMVVQVRCNSRHGVGIAEGAQNHLMAGVVRVYRPGGAGFIGTALSLSTIGDLKFPAQSTKVNRTGLATLAAVAGAQDGDYLAVEFGVQHLGPVSGGAGAGLGWTDTQADDLPEDQVSTGTLNSWIELRGATSAGTPPLQTVRQGQGEMGPAGVYVPAGSTVEQGLLSNDGQHYLNDTDVEVPDPEDIGLPATATDVRAALEAIVQGVGSSAVVDHEELGAAETFDFTDGSDHEGILDENLTVTLTGAAPSEAAWMTLKLTDDGDGPYTIAWPAEVVWPGGEAPDPPAAGETLVVTLFSYDGGAIWFGSYPGTGGGSESSGRWEVVMTGSAPPEPVTNEAEDDWLYTFVED